MYECSIFPHDKENIHFFRIHINNAKVRRRGNEIKIKRKSRKNFNQINVKFSLPPSENLMTNKNKIKISHYTYRPICDPVVSKVSPRHLKKNSISL